MKRCACALLVAASLAQCAWADTEDDAPEAWWRPYVGVGYTWGGQTIYPAKIQPKNSTTTYDEDISAGAGLDLRLGLQLRPTGWPVALKLAYGHHVDGASGLDGWGAFHRSPLELGLSWAVSDRAWIGVGARHSLRPQLRLHYDNYTFANTAIGRVDERVQYSANTAPFVEAEWRLSPSFGLQVRAVREVYTVKSGQVDTTAGSAPIDFGPDPVRYRGTHMGLELAYYFR